MFLFPVGVGTGNCTMRAYVCIRLYNTRVTSSTKHCTVPMLVVDDVFHGSHHVVFSCKRPPAGRRTRMGCSISRRSPWRGGGLRANPSQPWMSGLSRTPFCAAAAPVQFPHDIDPGGVARVFCNQVFSPDGAAMAAVVGCSHRP
jgi:hypothetical protein